MRSRGATRLPDLQRRVGGVPPRERAARRRPASRRRRTDEPQAHRRRPRHARRRPWPGSRAKAPCTSSCATDGSTDVQLQIYEPPRFYEAFLRGRAWTEPPDITARICGICPVAYQMSACWAIEDACGVTVPEAIRLMRRLLYCGEWIESHALHVFLLHAPDFLGYDGAIEMAADHRDGRRDRAAAEEGRQRADDRGRRPLGPSGQRPGRRLPPDAVG